jgi:anti-anti-sigma factor
MVKRYEDLVDRAHREGFRSVALTGDAQSPPGDPPSRQLQHADEVVAREQLVDQVTACLGIGVLCRYDPFAQPRDVLNRLLALHFHNVDDVHWGADVIDGRLTVSGEIDLTDIERFREVVKAATRAGVTTIDLDGVRLLAASAMGVLADLATRLARSGQALVLANPPGLVLETLSISGLIDHPGLRVIGQHSSPGPPGAAEQPVAAYLGPSTDG